MNSPLSDLKDLYAQLEKESATFKQKTGLRCKPGCGACCMRPADEIEASSLEADLLLSELKTKQSTEDIMSDLKSFDRDKACPFLVRTESPIGGFCSVYEARPLVCRLFGVGGIYTKGQKPRLLLSRVMREEMADLVAKTEHMVSEVLMPPISANYQLAVDNLQPFAQKLPLDRAVLDAIQRDYFRNLMT